MISRLLRRLSVRHPMASFIAQAAILGGTLAIMLILSIRDLAAGRTLLRPVLLLIFLILVSIRFATSGLGRKV